MAGDGYTFIDRPYPIFPRIVDAVQIHTSGFPNVVHTVYDIRGTVVATINKTEGVTAIITGLKLFAKCTVDSYACDLVSAARTVDTHNIISLYTGFRNLYFQTSYRHILKYLTDRVLRLADGDTRSAYTSTLSQVQSNDVLSVLDDRREETIVFENTSVGATPPHRNGVPTEVSYDIPIRDNRISAPVQSTNAEHQPYHNIPATITCPQVPDEILVTLSPAMVNAMYKNLCAIYSSRYSGTIP
jgi:hypothetical protein